MKRQLASITGLTASRRLTGLSGRTRAGAGLTAINAMLGSRSASSTHPLAGAFFVKSSEGPSNNNNKGGTAGLVDEEWDNLLPMSSQSASKETAPGQTIVGQQTIPVSASDSHVEHSLSTSTVSIGGSSPASEQTVPMSSNTSKPALDLAGAVEVTTTRRTTVTTTTTTTRRAASTVATTASSSAPARSSPASAPATGAPNSASSYVAAELLNRTFYRRPLPSNLISFESEGGRKMFKEAMAHGCAENYFSLAGNFATQHDPSSCGPSALSMVLNSLSIDPGRPWKGVWRWWSDSTLSCLSPLEELNGRGITFGGFERLAVCNGLHVVAKRGDRHSYEEFVADVRRICQSPGDVQMVISFSRKHLGQTGDGHFSPVAAIWEPSFDAKKSTSATTTEEPFGLVLDVARFKYPSYFVSLRDLYESTKLIDRETGLSRGWYIMRKAEDAEIAEQLGAMAARQEDRPKVVSSRRRRNASVCEIGERTAAATARTKSAASASSASAKQLKGLKEAGLDNLISRVIPETFKSLYPAVNNMSPQAAAEAAKAPRPTIDSMIELAFSLVADHTTQLSAPIMDLFLPRVGDEQGELVSEIRNHKLFGLISSLVHARTNTTEQAPSWTPERVTLLFLALPPACFKPFILSAFPDAYDLIEGARSAAGSKVLETAVSEWRMEWERRTQQTCDCH